MLKPILLRGLLILLAVVVTAQVHAAPPAKKLFGARKLPALMKPAVHGFYSKGCVQGAVALPTDGPGWQAMRLSRNRRWGHPDLINMVVKLSRDARRVGWNGLLVGDMSQARGGPMLTGHASHQLGLDADIWLNPMPNRRYTYREREQTSAQSMLARTAKGKINKNRISRRFTNAHFKLIRTAARYSRVERILVHPTIKRELCKRATGDRRWLYKVRPYWGHHYHMHVRLSCPAGSPNCRPQKKPAAKDGCGSELAYWNRILNPKRVKKKPGKEKKPVKRKKKRQLRLADLPNACRVVLNAAAPRSADEVTLKIVGANSMFVPDKPIEASLDAGGGKAKPVAKQKIAVPRFRPTK